MMMPRAFIVLLLTASAVAVALLAVLWLGEREGWSPPAAQRLSPESLTPVSITGPAPTPSGHTEQVNRPLFSATRRPPPEQPLAEAAMSPAESSMTVVGLFRSGSQEGAIVRTEEGVARVPVGGSLGAFQLQAIALDRAIFVRGGREYALELKRGAQTGARPAGVSYD